MTIGKSPFQIEPHRILVQRFRGGGFDIKKGEVPSERLAKFTWGVLIGDSFMSSLA
jgi:hypothetical protein